MQMTCHNELELGKTIKMQNFMDLNKNDDSKSPQMLAYSRPFQHNITPDSNYENSPSVAPTYMYIIHAPYENS